MKQILSLLFLVLASNNSVHSQTSTKKNVVFIIADDLNPTLGCYEHPTVLTPNIDKLASRGILFNNAYCNYPVCNPSRSSFLTGVRPENLGILDNNTTIASKLGDKITLPYLFKINGYKTVSLGKVFHGENDFNDTKAWSEHYNFQATKLGLTGKSRNMTDDKLKWCTWRMAGGEDEDQSDGQSAKKAVDFIKAPHDEPFFLAVGFHKPHDPFVAPKKYFDLYPLKNCTPPKIPAGWVPPFPYTLPSELPTFQAFTDTDKREFLRSYYAGVSFMDAQVGKVIDALEKAKLMENTIVIFIGDHGYHLGEQMWWNKVTLYQKGHNAPMIIVNGDGENAGVKTNAMIEFIDVYPTLANICSLNKTPSYLEGKDFSAVLKNPLSTFRSSVTAIVNRGNFRGKTIKTEGWRYTEWDNGNKGTELYNELTDSLEYNNLAEDKKYDDVKNMMKKLLVNSGIGTAN